MLKNVRAVILFDPSHPVPHHLIHWLAQKHRAQNLGVPSVLAQSSPQLQRDPFVKLSYPHGSISRIFSELSLDTPDYVREAVVLASCYASPLLVLGEQSLGGSSSPAAQDAPPKKRDAVQSQLQPLAVWERRCQHPLREGDLLNYLRIAGQGLTDFSEMTEEAHHTLVEYIDGHAGKDALEALMAKRQEVAKKEGQKRFWRLKEEGGGHPVVQFLDPLRLILPWLLQTKHQSLRTLPFNEFTSLAMGLVCAFSLREEALTAKEKPPQERRRHRRRGRHLPRQAKG